MLFACVTANFASVLHDVLSRNAEVFRSALLTSSSAVAERPRNASCLSVVSFNMLSAIFHYQLPPLQIYRWVLINSVLFSHRGRPWWLWQDSLMRGGLCGNCTVDRRYCWSHCSSHRSDSHSPIIAIFACPTCIRRPRYGSPRRNIAITFDKEKN